MAAESKVVLRTPDDWESFEIHLHRQARSLKLLDYLLENKELLPEPIPPNMENYQKKPPTSTDIDSNGCGHTTDLSGRRSCRGVFP